MTIKSNILKIKEDLNKYSNKNFDDNVEIRLEKTLKTYIENLNKRIMGYGLHVFNYA